jgi:hypothetical protein
MDRHREKKTNRDKAKRDKGYRERKAEGCRYKFTNIGGRQINTERKRLGNRGTKKTETVRHTDREVGGNTDR